MQLYHDRFPVVTTGFVLKQMRRQSYRLKTIKFNLVNVLQFNNNRIKFKDNTAWFLVKPIFKISQVLSGLNNLLSGYPKRASLLCLKFK